MGFYDFKFEQSGNAQKFTEEYFKNKIIRLVHNFNNYEAKILKITDKAFLFEFNNENKWIPKTMLEIKENENEVTLINTYHGKTY